MTSILDSLIEDYKDNDLDTQLKKICDKIYEEEKGSLINPDLAPKGPNIFLTIQMPTQDNINFLTFERIMDKEYAACLWRGKEKVLKVKTIDIRQHNNDVKKILKEFARHYKIMKGK